MNAMALALLALPSLLVAAAPAGPGRGPGTVLPNRKTLSAAALEVAEAKALLDGKDVAGARVRAAAALRLVPELSEAHFLMARILYVEANYREALREIVTAEAVHEQTFLMKTRAEDEAAAQGAERRFFNPRIPPDYFFVHGDILLGLEDREGASAQYERGLNFPSRLPISPPAPAQGSSGC